jgi:hypothetical protein
MSEPIQRWDFDFNDLDWRKDVNGPWVKAEAAEAAVAAARAEVGEDRVLGDVMAEHYRNTMTGPTQLSASDEEEVYSLMQSYEQGQSDEREAAAERVAALPIWSLHYYSGIPLIRQADAVAAIKGDSE